MTEFILREEAAVRFGVFAALLLTMALWEAINPKRRRIYARHERWFSNLGLVVVDTLLMRIALPLLAVDVALFVGKNKWGLFNSLEWSGGLEILIAIVLLDLVVYWQHRIFHQIPILWRLHKVHHTDVDFDVTTALRFHPVEIALSMVWKIIVVLTLGASPLAVVLFEVTLNGCAMFNHANIALPLWLDRLVRALIVTPDMHRVHHSIYPSEHDSNYGFNLSLWDRLFRTYTAQPRDGHLAMTIGQKNHLDENPKNLIWSLMLPFRQTKRDSDQKKASGDQKKLSGK